MRIRIADLTPDLSLASSYPLRTQDSFIKITADQSHSKLEFINANTKGPYFQQSYLDCLKFAWSKHLGITFSPDILWYTLLSEINTIVKQNTEPLRHLFSKSKDIQFISVPALDDLKSLVDALRDKVPINLDLFLPKFSTSDDYSLLTHRAAFLDTVSPYYAYFTWTCGIPFVDILGTQEDWDTISNNWKELAAQLNIYPDYFKKVQEILNIISTDRNNPTFWRNIFSLEEFEPCGAKLIIPKGWFTDLFCRDTWTGTYPLHNSIVKYNCNDVPYQLITGVISSNLSDDLLTPHFGHAIFKDLGPKAEEDKVCYMA